MALPQPEEARATPQDARQNRRRIMELGKDLRRKEKSLAETTVLLVLAKKMYGLPPNYCTGNIYDPKRHASI